MFRFQCSGSGSVYIRFALGFGRWAKSVRAGECGAELVRRHFGVGEVDVKGRLSATKISRNIIVTVKNLMKIFSLKANPGNDFFGVREISGNIFPGKFVHALTFEPELFQFLKNLTKPPKI